MPRIPAGKAKLARQARGSVGTSIVHDQKRDLVAGIQGTQSPHPPPDEQCLSPPGAVPHRRLSVECLIILCECRSGTLTDNGGRRSCAQNLRTTKALIKE